MNPYRIRLVARVSSDSPRAVQPVLTRWVGARGVITPTADGFNVTAEVEGGNVRELNRQLLSELRRAEKRTRLRSEWTVNGTTERFFDYVPQGVYRDPPSPRR